MLNSRAMDWDLDIVSCLSMYLDLDLDFILCGFGFGLGGLVTYVHKV